VDAVSFDIRHMLDPVPIAREAGRTAGRKEMREQLRAMFASFATTHPDQVISDELWTFVGYIDRMDMP